MTKTMENFEEESNITSVKTWEPTTIITAQTTISIEDLSNSKTKINSSTFIPIKVFKSLLMDNNATTANNSLIITNEPTTDNSLNITLPDAKITNNSSTMINETKEFTKLDVFSKNTTIESTTKTPSAENLSIGINTTVIPSIESITSEPTTLFDGNSVTSPVETKATTLTSSMNLTDLSKALPTTTTSENLLNKTEENTITTILISQTSEEPFENSTNGVLMDNNTSTSITIESTTNNYSNEDLSVTTITSIGVTTTKNDSLIVSSTEMVLFSNSSGTFIPSLTINNTAVNVTSGSIKKPLSITDCLTDIILVVLVVVFILLLIILLILCFYKPAAPVIIVEEEKTIIIKESRYISNPEDVEFGEENRPDNFMALRSTFLTTSGSEDYDPTGLTNISEESETSDSIVKKKEEKNKDIDEEDEDNKEIGEQIKSKDGVEVPETLQELPSPSMYSDFSKPANVAKGNKPSLYDW
uniref:Uncharacterized protein n=1 Tax=Meloidogyne hapla TaxID=6305 RepID=A0A1I8BAQ2_MELHA